MVGRSRRAICRRRAELARCRLSSAVAVEVLEVDEGTRDGGRTFAAPLLMPDHAHSSRRRGARVSTGLAPPDPSRADGALPAPHGTAVVGTTEGILVGPMSGHFRLAVHSGVAYLVGSDPSCSPADIRAFFVPDEVTVSRGQTYERSGRQRCRPRSLAQALRMGSWGHAALLYNDRKSRSCQRWRPRVAPALTLWCCSE